MFRNVKKIHFVGIGGIGMSGIAELLMNLEYEITGSDLNDSDIIQNLIKKGAIISTGKHVTKNIADCEVLVYSSAIRESNPELIAAKKKGIPVIRRAEMLAELIAVKETSIAVSGTHGKTSTSSMIGSVLNASDHDPTLVVGGLVQTLNTNSLLGLGDIIVVEADEFDRSFLALRPTISIVTNIELEHTDCYVNLEELQAAFVQFCNSVPFYGGVIVCLDSPGINDIIPDIYRPLTTYGISKNADYRAENIKFKNNTSTFTAYTGNKKLGKIILDVPGHHNILNSLAAIANAMEMDIPFNIIQKGLSEYQGVRRRFEIKGTVNDIMVVDDYAHHPTEVSATLNAARSGWNRRIVAVFQPHLFTRTRDFYRDFAKAFLDSDILVVTDIYPAREDKIEGIDGELVVKAAKDLGHKNVHYLPDIEEMNRTLDIIVKPGDMVIGIGAGTIWRYIESFEKYLESKSNL
jgi:UDP-N-acetylmuramate--alanine ligase